MRFSTSPEGKDNLNTNIVFKMKPGMSVSDFIAEIRQQPDVLLSRINFDDEKRRQPLNASHEYKI